LRPGPFLLGVRRLRSGRTIAVLCSEHSIVNSDGRQGVAVTLRCKCWNCDICLPFNRMKVVRKVKTGKPSTLITLTARPHEGETPHQRARKLVEAWRTVRRRIAAKYKCKPPAFMAVFEATKKGEPHLHIVARLKWVDQRWLSAQMAALNDSPIVDLRRIRQADRAATYVAKYLGKDPHRFKGTKRFWTSLDWLDAAAKKEDRPQLFGDHWQVERKTLERLELELLEEGFSVIRTRNKLIFESGTEP